MPASSVEETSFPAWSVSFHAGNASPGLSIPAANAEPVNPKTAIAIASSFMIKTLRIPQPGRGQRDSTPEPRRWNRRLPRRLPLACNFEYSVTRMTFLLR